jgi:hypothetical protein
MAIQALLAGVAAPMVKDIIHSTLGKVMKGGVKLPFNSGKLGDILKTIKSGISKTPAANPFSIQRPSKFGPTDKMNQIVQKLIGKLTDISSILKKSGEIGDLLKKISGFASNSAAPSGSANLGPSNLMPEAPTGSTGVPSSGSLGFSSSASTPTSTSFVPSGTASSQPVSNSPDLAGSFGGQWDMFNKMVGLQQAAQAFELAVKIAELKHQMAMSAIRAIKY